MPGNGRRQPRLTHPNLTAPKFKKGQSGNPGGRPKGIPSMSHALWKILNEPAPGQEGKTYGEMIVRVLTAQALKGNISHIAEVFDRTEGKAKQTHEVKVETGQAIIERTKAARRAAAMSRNAPKERT